MGFLGIGNNPMVGLTALNKKNILPENLSGQ